MTDPKLRVGKQNNGTNTFNVAEWDRCLLSQHTCSLSYSKQRPTSIVMPAHDLINSINLYGWFEIEYKALDKPKA